MTPFSKSPIWHSQDRFYATQGIQAWNNKIPYYITNSVFYAESCANWVISLAEAMPDRERRTFRILEVGGGSGMFAFYFIKHIRKYLINQQNPGWDMAYVLSDFNEANLQNWQTHPWLKEFAAKGWVSFLQLDLKAELSALDAQLKRSPALRESSSGPLLVVANYVLDTLPHDCFTIRKGELQEFLLDEHFTVPAESAAAPAVFPGQNDLREQAAVAAGHYADPRWNAVLQECAARSGEQACFTFPAGSLAFIDALQTSLAQPMLLLVADKGFSDWRGMARENALGLALHDNCFSMNVNFAALEAYAAQHGGSCFLSGGESIQYGILSLGFAFDRISGMHYQLEQHWMRRNPGHFFELIQHMELLKPHVKLEVIVGLLEITGWDPIFFAGQFDVMLASVAYASLPSLQNLGRNLDRIANNVFLMPGCADVFLLLGRLAMALNDMAKAQVYFLLSSQYFPADAERDYQMGICAYAEEKYDMARQFWGKAVKQDPEHYLAHGRLAALNASGNVAREAGA